MQDSGLSQKLSFQRLAEGARASRSELGLLVLLGLGIVAAALAVILRTSDPPAPPVYRQAPAARPGPGASSSSSPEPGPEMVVVHVAGPVARPGVYRLPKGSRVADAVAAAGGPVGGADANALNLAAPLADGEKITLVKPGEPVPPSGDPAQAAPGAINLNTATQAQLEQLPAVGPVLAKRILAYRQSKGRFNSPKQLMEVSGFGPKRFANLKELITV